MKNLIITGDDFGYSIEINEAIEIAHRNGILSATSLMPGESASADAVLRAKKLPKLKVGLHLVLVQGTPVSDPAQIPDLVTGKGVFHDTLFTTGVLYFFKPGVRRQLETEIRAQFRKFAETGLELDHVNAHNHMHLHPTVLGLILKVGREYNMRAMRIPYEPLTGPGHVSLMASLGGLFSLIGLAPWTLWMRQRLKKAAIFSNDYIFGLNYSGHMSESHLLHLLNNLPDGSSEIYFHPEINTKMTTGPRGNGIRGNPELQALISPKVIKLLKKLNLQPTGFADLIKT